MLLSRWGPTSSLTSNPRMLEMANSRLSAAGCCQDSTNIKKMNFKMGGQGKKYQSQMILKMSDSVLSKTQFSLCISFYVKFRESSKEWKSLNQPSWYLFTEEETEGLTFQVAQSFLQQRFLGAYITCLFSLLNFRFQEIEVE